MKKTILLVSLVSLLFIPSFTKAQTINVDDIIRSILAKIADLQAQIKELNQKEKEIAPEISKPSCSLKINSTEGTVKASWKSKNATSAEIWSNWKIKPYTDNDGKLHHVYAKVGITMTDLSMVKNATMSGYKGDYFKMIFTGDGGTIECFDDIYHDGIYHAPVQR